MATVTLPRWRGEDVTQGTLSPRPIWGPGQRMIVLSKNLSRRSKAVLPVKFFPFSTRSTCSFKRARTGATVNGFAVFPAHAKMIMVEPTAFFSNGDSRCRAKQLQFFRREAERGPRVFRVQCLFSSRGSLSTCLLKWFP